MRSAAHLVVMLRHSPRRLHILDMDIRILLIHKIFPLIHSGVCVTWNVLDFVVCAICVTDDMGSDLDMFFNQGLQGVPIPLLHFDKKHLLRLSFNSPKDPLLGEFSTFVVFASRET